MPAADGSHFATPPGRPARIAIVLFNLGGPDKLESVRPFLLNLFRDPAILRVPFLIRPLLARIIANARVKPASATYAILGGKSPLLALTIEQAAALEQALPEYQARCFIAMRYWHPFARQAARAVAAWQPDQVLLLPLYPHFSTTTTGSSMSDWYEAAAEAGLVARTTALCCYYADPAFVRATAAILARSYAEARAALDPAIPLRVLFSAHGLPEIIIRQGDPYQMQIERSVQAVLQAWGAACVDHVVCYQSRATPQKWIGPSTEVEIERAGADRVAVLIAPIAFVSEHSETLVELDVDYRHLAERNHVPGYFRVPAQNSDPGFIGSLATLARTALAREPGLCAFADSGRCAARHTECPHLRAGTPVPASGPLSSTPISEPVLA